MRLLRYIKMIFFDILTLIVVVWMVIEGLRKGLVAQILSLAGIIVGVALAIAYGEDLALALTINEKYAAVAGFLIIFIITLIAAAILSFILSKTLSSIGLGWMNRLLGVFFALLKGVTVLGMLYAAIFTLNNAFQFVEPRRFDKSSSFNIVRKVAEPLLNYWDKAKQNETSSTSEI